MIDKRYICSVAISVDIYDYCANRQKKKNPCKNCKYGVDKKYGVYDCIFTDKVKTWH